MKKWIKRILILAVLLAAAYIAAPLIAEYNWENERKKLKEETYISFCAPADHEQVARNPEKMKGTSIAVSGAVIQVMESGKKVTMLILDPTGGTWYASYRYRSGEPHILENDAITVYGSCSGTVTYKSVSGRQITVPAVDGYFVR